MQFNKKIWILIIIIFLFNCASIHNNNNQSNLKINEEDFSFIEFENKYESYSYHYAYLDSNNTSNYNNQLSKFKTNGIVEEIDYSNNKIINKYNSKTNDLWKVIKQNLKLKPNYQDKRFKKFIKSYKNNQNFFYKLVKNGGKKYLHYIINELQKRNMPLDLVGLVVIESMLDPYAFSHAYAIGLWQFTRVTADIFLIEKNWWYDGRRDIIESTNKALIYLQELKNSLDDWQLAMAAYNTGEFRIKAAVRRNKKNGLATDFWSLKGLPKETLNYVPKIMAFNEIIKNSSVNGIYLPTIKNEPYFTVIKNPRQVDLDKFLKDLKLSRKEFNYLNPGYNKRVTKPNKSAYLLIPIPYKNQAKKILTKYYKEKNDYKWHNYLISSYENIDGLIKRFNIDKKMLEEANDLKDLQKAKKKNKVSMILLPIPQKKEANFLSYAKIKLRRYKYEEQDKSYKVKKGDTLWNIARKFNINIYDLAKLNNINIKDPLIIGKKLRIKLLNEIKLIETKYDRKVIKTFNYLVKKGDNLSKIAYKFGVNIGEILLLNNIVNSSMIKPGQRIKINFDMLKYNNYHLW